MQKAMESLTRNPLADEIRRLQSENNRPETLRSLIRLAYHELHSIAVRRCRRERHGLSLQPTDLLNTACVRLLLGKTIYKNPRHFFGAASNAMRQILVDSARERHAQKRGAGLRRVGLDEAEWIGFEQTSDLLDFHAALSHLEAIDRRWSEVAELRVFGGFSNAEVAKLLCCGKSTVRRRWKAAKEWLAWALQAPATSRRQQRCDTEPCENKLRHEHTNQGS
jgi:RNA polymerase sigma-70 factor, ECF subfamily